MSAAPVSREPAAERALRQAALQLGLPLGLLCVGALVPSHPLLALAFVPLAVAAILLARAAEVPYLYARALAAILAGYMFFGKGFAYLGQSPVFVGEVVLLIGLVSIVATARVAKTTVIHVLLLAFMLLGAARTIPYLGTYHTSAARDGTLWGYAVFAFAVSYAMRAEHLGRAISLYRRVVPVFLLWVPVAALVAIGHLSPSWPNSGVPVVVFKGGDFGVHLAMVAAFILVGLYGLRRPSALRSESVLWLAWVVGVGVTIAVNRGAIIALSTILVLSAMLHWSTRVLQLGSAVAAAVVVLLVVNPSIPVGNGLVLSPTQLAANAVSIVTSKKTTTITATTGASTTADPSTQDLQGSKDFRLTWWKEIWGYTVHGPYFWTGKGFGINLADSDGFQITSNDSLRAPHNTHMTVLARMGVPGFVLWLILQATFAGMLLAAFRRARREGARRCAQLDAFLLAGWLAIMVNTTFDPYLEGPQGSIWFWAIVGAGIVAIRDQRRDLHAFEAGLDLGDPAETAA